MRNTRNISISIGQRERQVECTQSRTLWHNGENPGSLVLAGWLSQVRAEVEAWGRQARTRRAYADSDHRAPSNHCDEMTRLHRYYLRKLPRTVYRVETETGLVEVWSAEGWHPTSISMAHLHPMSHGEVNPKDVEELSALWPRSRGK